MTVAGIDFDKSQTHARVETSGPRIGPVGRLGEWLTRSFTIDLYDMDLQMESADLEYELLYGRR